MNSVTLEVLRAFGQGFGFNDLLPEGEDHAIHLQCGNGDIIGFQVVEEELLCFVRRSYEPVVLDALWRSLFSLIHTEEWQVRQWHIGLTEQNTLKIFTFLPAERLGTENLHQIFNEMWQLREELSQL